MNLFPPRKEMRHSELAQAMVRLGVGLGTAVYIWFGLGAGHIGGALGEALRLYTFAFLLVAAGLFAWILRRPGKSVLRRGATMLLDYGSLTFAMVIGEEYATPIFAVMVWVTVGYGVRYGQAYLVGGTSLALACIGLLAALSAYWADNIFLVITMVITVIIVPLYAFSLLRNLREARDAAIAATKAKSDFLAQASHDLRQPVHAIALFTACLRESGLDPDQRRMIGNIDRSLTSVIRLFRSLLDVSTLDSGKLKPRSELVALDALLPELAMQNEEAARASGGRINLVPSSLAFLGDPGLTTTILQNLISNAIKYAPGGQVVLGCRRGPGGTFAIWVVDNGPGIAPGEQARVFEEFYRSVAPGQDIEGVGLGLPIVRRMAEAMGLRVRLVSRLGHGTRVSIEGLCAVERLPGERPDKAPRPVTGLLNGMDILLIEDNADVLMATRTMLERWGCRVQASSGLPGDIGAVDLILTDHDLNGPLTGAECIAQIRERTGRELPAIIITGHDSAKIEAELVGTGIAVLSKPLQPAALRGVLMAHRVEAAEA